MIMEDYIPIPTTCLFSSSSRDHHPTAEAAPRPGQTAISSTYRTKISGICHVITVTWRRSALLRSLTVSIGDDNENKSCKVDLKPWSFRKRHGSKPLQVGPTVPTATVWWDLRAAKFHGETEPITGYYVAVVSGAEIVVLLGDMRDEAYKRAAARPAPIEPSLVSKRDHVYGKRRFSTRAKFHEKDKVHEITIECKDEVSCGSSNKDGSISSNNNGNNSCCEPEMEIRLDGNVLVKVKHLQWKFRGNELVHVDKLRVEVFWDVHDWLFSPGLRHALFIFKPVSNYSPAIMSSSSLSSSSTSSTPPESSSASTPFSSSGSFEGSGSAGSSEFCLFLYAWKVE